MKLPWSQIAGVAARIGAGILTGVPAIETLTRSLHTPGADKKATILDAVKTELMAAEFIAGRDLASDPDVLGAAAGCIDAFVHLHNILAAKSAAAGVV